MARPKKVDTDEVEKEAEQEEEEGEVLLAVELAEEVEVDENLFPPYKTIATSFPQVQLPSMLPTHDRNVAEIVKVGQYRVVDVYLNQSTVGEQVVWTYWTVLARDW